jgi:hypothetical protein
MIAYSGPLYHDHNYNINAMNATTHRPSSEGFNFVSLINARPTLYIDDKVIANKVNEISLPKRACNIIFYSQM